MILCDVTYDRESQSGATRGSAPSSIDPIEPLEDPPDVTSGNAVPLIGDEYLDEALVDAESNLDLAAGIAVLHGVLDEIAER